MKIMTLVGTRPELIKMSRVIAAFDEHTDHILVHTGQNYDYELNKVFFNELGIREPNAYMDAAVPGNAMQTAGNILTRTDALIEKHNPDAFLIYGDTNSGLSVIAAKRRKVPTFHMEAGNRSFDDRVPEEINRRIIDHTSDINFTLTQRAREYLLREGLAGNRVIVSGSHMPEILSRYEDNIAASEVLDTLGVVEGGYILISLHREENVDRVERIREITRLVPALELAFGVKVIMSTHPRTRARLENELDNINENIFLQPFGFFDYITLQKNAFCVISDSGTISEESNILGFPAITIRDSHERPEIMEVGGLIMAHLTSEEIINAVRVATSFRDQPSNRADDYRYQPVSKLILFTVMSYVRYVNREIWRKND